MASASTSLPAKQTAIIALPSNSNLLGLSHSIPIPTPLPNEVLVRTKAVGLNPVDNKMQGRLGYPSAIAGFDYAGIIISLGSSVTSDLKPGDRVCGAVFGMNPLRPGVGSFCQYLCAPANFLLRIPEGMSFEQGACLGVGTATAGVVLFRSLGVPGTLSSPSAKQIPVLVYGGSTATGTMCIQILKRCNLRPIATCSPKNFPLVQSYGAEKCFDYRSPTAVSDIRAYTRSSLKYALDCIAEPESMTFCYKVIGRLGGRYTSLEPYPDFLHTRSNIHPDWVVAPHILGAVGWDPPFGRPADPELMAWGVGFLKQVQGLLDEGKLRTHPVRVLEGGLERVVEGLDMLGRRVVSGEKLVVRVGE